MGLTNTTMISINKKGLVDHLLEALRFKEGYLRFIIY